MTGAFNLVIPFIQKYKLYLIIYTICVLLTYPLEAIIIPQLFSSFFEIIKNVHINKSLPLFNNFFFKIGGIMFIIIIAHTIQSNLDAFLIPEFTETISYAFYKNILSYYENNYTDLELGKIITRLNNAPSILKELSTDLFNWVIPKVLTIIVINYYFATFDINLSLISIIFILFVIYINTYYLSDCINTSYNKYLNYEQNTELIQDKLSNLFSIYSAGNVKQEIINYKNIIGNYKNIHKTSLSCNYNIKNINSIINTIIFFSLSIIITMLFRNNKISIGNLTTLFMVLIFYINCLNTITAYLPEYINHYGVISNINDYINIIYTPNIQKPNLIINNGSINIKNLNFSYNNTQHIFTNFNLIIDAKDKIAIIGHSGNGKSTLVKLIMGYYKIPENTIFIDNQDITKYNLNSLRTQITFINQNTKLFNTTIYNNIKYGNNITNNDIDYIYKKYNLQKIYKHLPNGFNTVVGVNGDSLSGGQKQIILLLRNYFKNNNICILDEPTSALDNDTRLTVINIIKDISKNSTLIIITHDENNLELVNKKIKINNSKII